MSDQVGMDSATLREVAQYSETEDTWRLYVKEWTVVFTEGQLIDGEIEQTKAEEWFEAKYMTAKGGKRLLDQDWKLVEHPMIPGRMRLEVRQWVLRGEFKHQDQAHEWALAIGGDPYEVVGRGTRAEVELRDYGKRVLR